MISTIITAVSRDESSIVTRILTEIYDYIQLITKVPDKLVLCPCAIATINKNNNS